jgi:hypothetical protein
MPKSLVLSGVVVLVGVSAMALPAMAQSARTYAAPPPGIGSYADPYWGRRGDLLCRRWCLSDRTPCDTVQQKAADGRCSGDVRSFYGELRCRIGDPRPECP